MDDKLVETSASQNGWLSLDISYEGAGRADFTDPIGYVKGHARATLEADGSLVVFLDVEEVYAEDLKEQPEHLQLYFLLTGRKPVQLPDGQRMYGGGGAEPRFADLSLQTAEGRLSAPNARYFGEVSLIASLLGGQAIRFTPSAAQYDIEGAGAPVFWVLPLTNFLSAFSTPEPDLFHHPLRILSIPKFRDDLPPESQPDVVNAMLMDINLITFEFDGSKGFIERVLGYPERKARLEEGRDTSLVTAVMVSEIGTRSVDDLGTWFPFDFLRLLGFATGIEVGAQWLEFRDANGGLVRRVHRDMGRPNYAVGHTVIYEECSRDEHKDGIGHLLTKAALVTDFGPGISRLSVALRQLLRAGLPGRTLEERLTILVRVLDGLCTDSGTAIIDLLVPLDATTRAQVEQARDAAADQIKVMSMAARKAGDERQARALQAIGSRMRGVTKRDEKFGMAARLLVKQEGLQDADVIDDYLQQAATTEGLDTWAGVLSYYRTIPIHYGFFDETQQGHDFKKAIAVMNHLHDVLIRLVLKRLGYEGAYQPVMKKGPTGVSVDWVTRQTPASELGYK